MELIVAVYDDWGIGKDGTQPIALSADRKFFRETTQGALVVVGRRTIEDFPGRKPLPGRVNVALTRQDMEIPGFAVCRSPEEVLELDGYDAPTFHVDESVTDFYAFTKDSFTMENYQYHPFDFEIPMAI